MFTITHIASGAEFVFTPITPAQALCDWMIQMRPEMTEREQARVRSLIRELRLNTPSARRMAPMIARKIGFSAR